MRSPLTLKMVLAWFCAVFGLYLAVFYGVEHWRQRGGPWQVEFLSDASGRPAVVVQQDSFHLAGVNIRFGGELAPQTNLAERVQFDRPLKLIPFGRKKYEDLTQLPGVLTFDFFGHEIELLPRTLVINRRERPWRSHETIELWPTNKVELPDPKRRKKRRAN